MFGAISFSWFMLPLGVALGVYWARQSMRAGHRTTSELEDPVPASTLLPGPESSDFDLQILLGSVYRQRGEIDRAMALHQRLLERPGLSGRDVARVQYELATDHVRSGVIDRAEILLEKLVGQEHLRVESLELLLQVREQAREWQRAIEVATQLEALKSQSYKTAIAQYHCELAEEAARRNESVAAGEWLERAIAADPTCARAYLGLGRLQESLSDHAAAINTYRRLAEKAPRFIGEALLPLKRCHEARSSLDDYEKFLGDAETRSSHPSIALMRGRRMLSRSENPVPYLSLQLEKTFSPEALDLLLESLTANPATPEALNSLRQILRQAFTDRVTYRCDRCGFTPKTLFWQCPSCKHWGSVTPAV